MTRYFIPKVTSTKQRPTAAMLAWAQGKADEAYKRLRLGSDGLETDAVEVCASEGPVPPHRDEDGSKPGMRVVGLVIRSDGQRLHSDALHASGNTSGLPLKPGDLYEIDPFDRHWTTVPDGCVRSELIFTVNIMTPDGRDAQKLAHDMWWSLLKASIEDKFMDRAA